jgi:type II secretion system protein G
MNALPMKKAFTLIELLVVISIIGVLATLLLANFNSTRSRARDAQRKSDLRNIQTALRLYYNDFGHYPAGSDSGQIMGCESGGTVACTWGETFATDTATYMSILPTDPLPDVDYQYSQTSGDEYTIVACLENKSDDKCDKNAGNIIPCGTDDYGCQYTVKP